MNKRTFKRYVRENGIDDKSREFFKKEFLDGMEIKKEDLDYLINLHLGMKSVKYLNIIKKMGSNFSKENYKEYLKFRKKNKYDSNSKEFYQIIYGENWEEKYNENREKNSHILENLKEFISWLEENFLEWKNYSEQILKEKIIEFIKSKDSKNWTYMWPLRACLSRSEKSPSPFEMMNLIGKKWSIKRVKWVLEKIEK